MKSLIWVLSLFLIVCLSQGQKLRRKRLTSSQSQMWETPKSRQIPSLFPSEGRLRTVFRSRNACPYPMDRSRCLWNLFGGGDDGYEDDYPHPNPYPIPPMSQFPPPTDVVVQHCQLNAYGQEICVDINDYYGVS